MLKKRLIISKMIVVNFYFKSSYTLRKNVEIASYIIMKISELNQEVRAKRNKIEQISKSSRNPRILIRLHANGKKWVVLTANIV